ncbi:polypeptide N-acetylgalactosaminyltransferase 4-like [Pecten maximus]|uniref:polypeptide N-acetylgalactosaminyltransferase 4-like n=1 Tax=Pecten maximus TaxID=6579 RepID=UPI0014585E7A|nr:polypeptide N-acetylgalactosaminyltransferase 4-like [Pecten maximus]
MFESSEMCSRFLSRKWRKLFLVMLVLSWAVLLLWITKSYHPSLDIGVLGAAKSSVRVNTFRKSYSEIIKEFNISIYKYTDPNRFHINVNKTHRTSVTRDVPDTRPVQCASNQYDIASLPLASIVVPLHNEPWSTLERTINSILNRSPSLLLKEIIIMDDRSDLDHLGAPLEKYAEEIGIMKIYRAKERLGTMKSRVVGAQIATGDVVVFLDSHTEVNVGWLEPILYEIGINYTTIIQPSIDLIDPETFEYKPYFRNNMRGHFRWSMAYEYVPLTLKQETDVAAEPTKAFNTPAIVGCAFAANRNYFQDIGGLDTGMRTWGGEDIELSVRVWLCGGSMKISPCSHVAHIHKHGHPFKTQYSDLVYNNKRTAEMWLGSYRKYFYKFNSGFAIPPKLFEKYNGMDTIKNKFKCKDFSWFLKHVFPELEIPPEGSEYFGHLRNLGSNACFGPTNQLDFEPYPVIAIGDCYFYYKVRNFALLQNGRLMVDGKCVNVRNNFLIVSSCSSTVSGKFRFDGKQLVYTDLIGTKCVAQVPKDLESGKLQVAFLMPCDKSNTATEWELQKLYKVSNYL